MAELCICQSEYSILVLLVIAGSTLVVDFQGLHPGPFYPLFSALVILPLLGGWMLVYTGRFSQEWTRTRGMLLAAALFITLDAGLLLYPLALLPRFAATAGLFVQRCHLGWLRSCAAVAQQPGIHPKLGSLAGDRGRCGLGIRQRSAAGYGLGATHLDRKMAGRRDR